MIFISLLVIFGGRCVQSSFWMEILKDLFYDRLGGMSDESKPCRIQPPNKKLRKTTLSLYLPEMARKSRKRERILTGIAHSPGSGIGDGGRTRSKGNLRLTGSSHLQLHDSVKSPLVVFVHGGGWRRGHTENWRYFLSRFDTNLLMALYSRYYGHYGNVGESFAHSGLACAVVTYPLMKPPIKILLIESVTSFLMSWLVFLVPLLALYLVFGGTSWAVPCDETTVNQLSFQHLNLCVAVLLSLLMSQAVTKVLVVLHVSNYNSSEKRYPEILIAFLHVFLLMYLSFCLTCTFITTSKLQLLATVDTVCTQSLIIGVQIWNRYIGNGNDFAASVKDQVTIVARAIRQLADLAVETHVFSANDMVLCGHSAGGSIVSLLGLDESYFVTAGVQQTSIKGIISICGIYDISCLGLSPFTSFFYLGPVFGENVGDWKSLSPVHQIKKTNQWKCPFLIASSHWEPIIRTDTDQFEAVLHSSGYTCTRIELTNKNHINILNSFSRQDGSCFLQGACLEFIETL